MDGVPWELDQLPRGQHPNPVGDIFGAPPVRKPRTRKQPKDLTLDTINERERHPLPPTPANSLATPILVPRAAASAAIGGGSGTQTTRAVKPKPAVQPHLRRDAATSTTDLGGRDDGAEGGKKVQKGQINTLAKLLSAMTGGNGRK